MFLNGVELDGKPFTGKDSYLNEIPSIQQLRRLDFSKPVTFFIGENGSGKSTLLEAIAVAFGFNPEEDLGISAFPRRTPIQDFTAT